MKQEGPVKGREQDLTAHGPSECAWWEKKEEGDGARGRSVSLSGKVLGGGAGEGAAALFSTWTDLRLVTEQRNRDSV